jgi:pimeloyl-ACP methyl ester carboxylesterase
MGMGRALDFSLVSWRQFRQFFPNTLFLADNYDALASQFDRIIAVDWKGMGLSNRASKPMSLMPSVWFYGPPKDEVLKVSRTVTDELIDSLEELRVEIGLSRFVLAGHSMGGYLCTKYALKYPTYIEGLVLLSPAGIQSHPHSNDEAAPSDISWKFRLAKDLWAKNITPMALLRIAGPWGPDMVPSLIQKKFGKTKFNPEQLKIMSDYLYHITAAPAHGEYALNALLEPKFIKYKATQSEFEETASDKNPKHRVHVLARDPLEPAMCELKTPVLILYGDQDWIAYPGVHQSVELWRQHGVDAEVQIIPYAGHHLYTDNAVVFNQTIIDWVQRKVHSVNLKSVS